MQSGVVTSTPLQRRLAFDDDDDDDSIDDSPPTPLESYLERVNSPESPIPINVPSIDDETPLDDMVDHHPDATNAGNATTDKQMETTYGQSERQGVATDAPQAEVGVNDAVTDSDDENNFHDEIVEESYDDDIIEMFAEEEEVPPVGAISLTMKIIFLYIYVTGCQWSLRFTRSNSYGLSCWDRCNARRVDDRQSGLSDQDIFAPKSTGRC